MINIHKKGNAPGVSTSQNLTEATKEQRTKCLIGRKKDEEGKTVGSDHISTLHISANKMH